MLEDILGSFQLRGFACTGPFAWNSVSLGLVQPFATQLGCPLPQEALPDLQVGSSIHSGLPISALLTLCHHLLGMGGLYPIVL